MKFMKKLRSQQDTPPEIRRIGVLVEDIDRKIGGLVEGHQAHEESFERFEKKMDEGFMGIRNEMDYKFEIVFEELHTIRNEQVKRQEFVLLEKRVLEIEKRLSQRK
mgnify:CR=1 FL=1